MKRSMTLADAISPELRERMQAAAEHFRGMMATSREDMARRFFERLPEIDYEAMRSRLIKGARNARRI